MPKVPSVLCTTCVKVEYHGPTDHKDARWFATNVNSKKRIIRYCRPELSTPEDAARVASELLDTDRMYSSSIDGGGWLFMARRDKAPRKKYLIEFTGRINGAIGVFYPISLRILATSKQAARKRVYETYDSDGSPIRITEF